MPRPPRLCSLALLLGLGLALGSCDLRPPYVYLSLVLAPAPDAPAAQVASVAVGFGPSTLAEVPTQGKPFPLTATVASATAGERELFVEARDASGQALARGRVLAKFPEVEQGEATVTLRRSCEAHADCDSARFCDGAGQCSGAGIFGFCARAPACGEPPFPCVTFQCQEETDQCLPLAHHDLCPPVADEQGILRPRMCEAAAGCVAVP